VFDDCLLDAGGNIFPAMALTRESFNDGLSDFDLAEMIPADSLDATTVKLWKGMGGAGCRRVKVCRVQGVGC
jgi:hypothetical protein